MIDRSLTDSNVVILEGESGSGKTSLAREYGYTKSASDPNYWVRFLSSITLLAEYDELAREFNIDTKEDYFHGLKTRLKQMSAENNLEFLFIIDNVDESQLGMTLRFVDDVNDDRIKFILTTKCAHLNDGYHTFILNSFGMDDLAELTKNKSIHLSPEEKAAFSSTLFKQDAKVLPLKLDRLLTRVKKSGHTHKVEHTKSLLEKDDHRFRLIKNECSLAFEVLNYLAFLCGEYVSYDLLKSLLISSQEDLTKALDYLVRNLEVFVNQRGEYSMNESAQSEFRKHAIFASNIEDLFEKIVMSLNSLLCEEDIKVGQMNYTTLNLINQARYVLKYDCKTKSTNRHVSDLIKKLALVKNEQDSNEKTQTQAMNARKSNIHRENLSDKVKKLLELSGLNQKNCDFELALENLNEAFEICTNILPSDHPELANILVEIANIKIIYEGDYGNALKKYEQALAVLNKDLPENQILVANIIFGIANAHNYQGL